MIAAYPASGIVPARHGARVPAGIFLALVGVCCCTPACSRLGHHTVIRSFPAGAIVAVDSRELGPTPAVFHESGEQGRTYAIKLTKDEYEPLLDAVRSTVSDTSPGQWNPLWRLPGVERIEALPDTMWYILRHPRWRFADAPLVSERVALTSRDPEDLLPEVHLAFEYTKEFDSAAREYLGVEGHVLHFRARAEREATFPLIFGFVQGEEDYVPDLVDPTEIGVFGSRVALISQEGLKGEREAGRALRQEPVGNRAKVARLKGEREAGRALSAEDLLPTGDRDSGMGRKAQSRQGWVTPTVPVYRQAEEHERLGAEESVHGWVVLPQSLDLESPMTLLWGDETTVATLKPTGRVESVRHDGVLVLSSGERVRLAGVEFVPRSTPEGWGEVIHGLTLLELISQGQTVSLEPERKERNVYGELVCYVYLGDTLLNLLVAEQGLARIKYHPEGPFFDRLSNASLSAREEARGLWGVPEGQPLGLVIEKEPPSEEEPGEAQEEADQVSDEGWVVAIRNRSDEAVSLHGFQLYTDAGPSYRFREVILPEGEVLRLHLGKGTDKGLDLFWGLRDNPWAKGSVKALLCDPDGTVLDIHLHSAPTEEPQGVAEESGRK